MSGSVSLGWVFHAAMSAKARLWRLLILAYRWLVASAPSPRTASFERQEPSLGGRAAPSLAPQAEDDFEEDGRGREDEVRVARAPRKKAAARAPSRKSSDKFEMPPISVLTAPKASDRQPLSKVGTRCQFARAGRRARRFRRPRRNRQGPSRSGGDAVRTRARARHQIVARHRTGRRHRAFDERALGARRGGSRPQRHRHRTAEPASRKGLSARIAGGQGLQRIGRKTSALSRQEHRRRFHHRRPRAHAASADRRHHRLRQIGRHQHHDPQPAVPAAPGSMPPDHGRSQDARTLRL